MTLVLLFSFKGEVILSNPLTILWIAIPLFIQTVVIFALGLHPVQAVASDLRERCTERNDRGLESF